MREAVDKEAGVTLTQWYVHSDGDSRDFPSISPEATEAQDKKVKELAKRKGLKTGFAGVLELRQFIATHTDTLLVALSPRLTLSRQRLVIDLLRGLASRGSPGANDKGRR